MTVFLSRLLGPIPVDVVIRENHDSSLGITENAVENGAKITDHAYIESKRLRLEFADRNAAATYNAMVRFQETRQPFQVITGLFMYKNMLFKSINAERDQYTGKILKGDAILQEIIIVSTARASGTEDGGGSGDKKAGQQDTKNADAEKKPETVERGDQVAVTPRDQSVLHSWGIGPGSNTAPQSGQGPRGDT